MRAMNMQYMALIIQLLGCRNILLIGNFTHRQHWDLEHFVKGKSMFTNQGEKVSVSELYISRRLSKWYGLWGIPYWTFLKARYKPISFSTCSWVSSIYPTSRAHDILLVDLIHPRDLKLFEGYWPSLGMNSLIKVFVWVVVTPTRRSLLILLWSRRVVINLPYLDKVYEN